MFIQIDNFSYELNEKTKKGAVFCNSVRQIKEEN